MTKYFLNLTNGLEKLEDIEFIIPIEQLNFTYIASTTLENKNYLKLLTELDHNLLFNLAIGNTCYFYDYGTNRPFSKTCYQGVPLIVYLLTRFWLGIDDESLCYRYDRRGENKIFDVKERYKFIYDYLFTYDSNKDKEYLKTKLKKYKHKFLITNRINLIPISKSTINDGNYEYHKNIIKTKLLK